MSKYTQGKFSGIVYTRYGKERERIMKCNNRKKKNYSKKGEEKSYFCLFLALRRLKWVEYCGITLFISFAKRTPRKKKCKTTHSMAIKSHRQIIVYLFDVKRPFAASEIIAHTRSGRYLGRKIDIKGEIIVVRSLTFKKTSLSLIDIELSLDNGFQIEDSHGEK